MAAITALMIDNSGESSSVTIPTHDAEALDTFGAWLTDSGALQAHLEAVSLLNFRRATFSQVTASGTEDIPNVPYADREAGMRFLLLGNESGRRYSFTVPGPDQLACSRVPGTDMYDMADEPLATFITWIEANYEPLTNPGNPVPDHETVTVERVIHVGRNN